MPDPTRSYSAGVARVVRFLCCAIATLLLAVAAAPSVTAATVDTTFAESGFADTTVQGVSATSGFFFALPAGATGDAPTTVDLEISHSPLLLGDRSTTTWP